MGAVMSAQGVRALRTAAIAAGALLVGGVAGALLGYHVRRNLTSSKKVGDLVVALAEDAITIVGAWLLLRAL